MEISAARTDGIKLARRLGNATTMVFFSRIMILHGVGTAAYGAMQRGVEMTAVAVGEAITGFGIGKLMLAELRLVNEQLDNRGEV